MSAKSQDSPSTAISLGDIYFILFRHKWMILFFSFAGVTGAVVLLLFVKPPQYQSEAMLSIRYVVEGKSPIPSGDEQNTKSLDERTIVFFRLASPKSGVAVTARRIWSPHPVHYSALAALSKTAQLHLKTLETEMKRKDTRQ
jgi:hypothetical protein